MKCRINTVVSPDDGHIVARNMFRLINILRTNVLRINFVHQFRVVYRIIQGCTVNKTKKKNSA